MPPQQHAMENFPCFPLSSPTLTVVLRRLKVRIRTGVGAGAGAGRAGLGRLRPTAGGQAGERRRDGLSVQANGVDARSLGNSNTQPGLPRHAPRRSQRQQAPRSPGPGAGAGTRAHTRGPAPPPPRPSAPSSHACGDGPSSPTEELRQNSRSSRRSSEHVGPVRLGSASVCGGGAGGGQGATRPGRGRGPASGSALLSLQPVPGRSDNKKLSSCPCCRQPPGALRQRECVCAPDEQLSTWWPPAWPTVPATGHGLLLPEAVHPDSASRGQ